jgi:hypothetical protein
VVNRGFTRAYGYGSESFANYHRLVFTEGGGIQISEILGFVLVVKSPSFV